MAAIDSFFQIFSVDTYNVFDPKIEIWREDQSCSIFDADSESEVEFGQFGREGQKQRSFGPKNSGFGVKMGQKLCFDLFWLQIRIHDQKLNKLITRVEIFLWHIHQVFAEATISSLSNEKMF